MSNSDSEILKLSRHFGMHVLVESVAGIYQELFAQLILIPIPPLLHSILDGRTDVWKAPLRSHSAADRPSSRHYSSKC